MARTKYSSKISMRILQLIVFEDNVYGYALCQYSGLKEGTVYPILKRLLADKYIEASWDLTSLKGPPRKRYKATLKGIEFLRSKRSQVSA